MVRAGVTSSTGPHVATGRRPRPVLFDAVTASPLLVVVLGAALGQPWEAVGLIAVAALAWRRAATTIAAAVVAASTAVVVLLVDGPPVTAVATPVMLYAVLAHGRRRTAWTFAVLCFAATIGVSLRGSSAEYGTDDADWVTVGLTFLAILVAAAFVGLLRRLVLVRRQALSDRDQQVTALAVAQERGRIAREVHDIVAHSLAVMIAQADAARLTVDADPAGAGQRMAAVADNGRRALGDIRQTLRALRDGPDAGLTLAPRPTLERLADLADAARAAGLATRLETVGARPAGLTEAWQLAVHRIVQEALTNVLKHAGAGARVVVRLEWRSEALWVAITDSGAGQPAAGVAGTGVAGTGVGGSAGSGTGMGVAGMRERTRAFGGTLAAGPRAGGGWQVQAEIPYVSAAALRLST